MTEQTDNNAKKATCLVCGARDLPAGARFCPHCTASLLPPAPVIDFRRLIAERTADFTGRVWVMKTIRDWLVDPSAEQIFLLTGEPGCGKTAVAAQLARFLSGEVEPPDGLGQLAPGRDRLTARHFCRARETVWANPHRFTESLTQQLARHPSFASALVQQLEGEDDATRRPLQVVHQPVERVGDEGKVIGIINRIESINVGAVPPEDAFVRAVRLPLETFCRQQQHTQVVLLVDALDEALVYSGPAGIVDLVAQTDQLPPNVRLLLTCRPDSTRVTNLFKKAERLSMSAREHDKDNERDIKDYVELRLGRDEKLTAQVDAAGVVGAAAGIAGKADGNFQYVSLLLQEMVQGLRKVTELAGLPAGLDELYDDSLTRVLKVAEGDWTGDLAPLMGLLSVAQEGVTAEQLQAFSGQPEARFGRNLRDLQQFVDVQANGVGPRCQTYQLYHESLVDFLRRSTLDEDGDFRPNTFFLPAAEWHRRIGAYFLGNYEGSWSSYLDEEGLWPELDFGLRHLVTHLVDGLSGSTPKARHDRTEQLIRTALDLDFQEAYLERLDDIPGLLRDLERALACAAADRHTLAAAPLMEVALGLVAFRRDHLRPEPIFELARQGELDAAERRLGLFGMERYWRWAILLLLAWLAPKDAAGRARELCDRCDAFLAGQELEVFKTVGRLLERVRAALDEEEWTGTMSGRVLDEYEVAAILQMVGGAGPEAVEGITYSGREGKGPRGDAEPTYQAALHGPPLVTYAWANPGDGTRFFQQYASAHANNSYERYRNLSLWELVKAILLHPGQEWVRDRAVELASGALGGSPVHFQSALRLAVLGMIGALEELDAIRDAAILAAGELVPMRGKADTWGHHLRRLCALAEVYALVLGDHGTADSLIGTARAIPFGFSGFWAPARLTLAETIQLCRPDDVPMMHESLDTAAESAHNVQDYVFCARTTARVNAMRERWWPAATFDVEAEIAELVANPGDSPFASRHQVLEGYEGRLPNAAIRLHIPDWAKEANKMSVLARVHERPAEQVARLNPDRGMDDDLDATDRVNMPDPDFAPLLAARFAAEALARDTLQPRRKVRLIQTLVPLAISNPTALDTILARLLLADPRNDKLATVLPEAAVRIRPELAHPDYDRFLDSLAYAASQLGPT